MKMDIEVVANVEELARKTADLFAREAREAVRVNGRFAVALSGGSTPKSLYSLLADEAKYREAIPWDQVHFFWGDERHVPPDHPESNYLMTYEALLSKMELPQANIHRIKSEESDAGVAADQYETEMREFFDLKAGEMPRFDLALLGLGSDGHTASLFPGTKALDEKHRLAVSNWVGKLYTDRITMTAPVFNQAALAIFLVAGADKAMPLKAVLEGPNEPAQLPAQLIHPLRGRLLWLVETSAGQLLDYNLRE